jgi:hypothetical protein
MLGWIHEKMAIQESALEVANFLPLVQPPLETTLVCSDPCTPCEDCSTATGNDSWDNAHTSDLSSRGERLGEKPSILVQRTQRTSGSLDG